MANLFHLPLLGGFTLYLKSFLTTSKISFLRKRFTSHHFYSTILADNTVCKCGTKVPESKILLKLCRGRNLRQLRHEIGIKCPYYKFFQFSKPYECELADAIEEIVVPLLTEFHDVVSIGNERTVLLDLLHEIPTGDLGDMAGDHGKQLAKFIRFCFEENYISTAGAILDIGGGNISTIKLISEVLSQQDLPSMIIDINLVTPALSKAQSNIKYVIDDALTFFSSETYENHVMGIVNEKPTLFIFNNILNVLKPEKAWETLEAAWSRLRSIDYLIISGLVPDQLEKYGFINYHEVDGIAEFHYKTNGFYKSALSPNVFRYLARRLVGSSVLCNETFTFCIESLNSSIIDVKGRRLLITLF